MAVLYAKCDHCDSIAESRSAVAGGGNSTICLTGASIGDCPCGGKFIVLGDEYVLNEDVATLTKGSIEDRELLARLLKVVRDSVAAGEAPEKTYERAAQIDPRLTRFKSFLIETAIALSALVEMADKASTIYDWYDTLLGNKGQREYAQQVKASKEGAQLALDEFYTTREYQDFKRRLDEQDLAPPPAKPASSSTSLKLHPMVIEFPITAQKLADYEKQRRKID